MSYILTVALRNLSIRRILSTHKSCAFPNQRLIFLKELLDEAENSQSLNKIHLSVLISKLKLTSFPKWCTQAMLLLHFEVKGSISEKQVDHTENELKGLCVKAFEIFISQPILLELVSKLKIFG